MELRAMKDIAKDEEITVSYLVNTYPHGERQGMLAHSFSFKCTCPSCTLPPAELTRRDAQQNDLAFAYQERERMCYIAQRYPDRLLRKFIALIEGIEQKIEQNGLEDYRIDFDHYLAKAYAMLGDEAKSREWARNAKSVERLNAVKGLGFAKGKEGEWDEWMQDPTSTPYWQAATRSGGFSTYDFYWLHCNARS